MSDPDFDPIFTDLFERFYQAILSLFLRRGFSREDARDLAQKTFVRVYERRGGYRGKAEWSWLAKIATTVGLNHLRFQKTAKRGGKEVALDLDYLPDVAMLERMGQRPQASPEDQVLRRESTQRLREAIEDLPKENRRYLEMRLQGFKYAEIAETQQVSMDTVKSQISRTKKQLKKKLGGTGEPWPGAKERDHEQGS